MKIVLAYKDLGDFNPILKEWFEDKVKDKSPLNESFLKYASSIDFIEDGEKQ